MERLAVRMVTSDIEYDRLDQVVRNFPIHCVWLNLERGIYYNFDYYSLLAVI